MSRLAERFIDRPKTYEAVKYPFSVQETVVAGDLGQCGGVRMALNVTKDLLDYAQGKVPVYANHQPVHNRLVIESFQLQGLMIEPDVDNIAPNSIWILSAHGTPPETVRQAKAKGIFVVNVECPLVTKVRREAQRTLSRGEHLVYLGVTGHPELIAVLGENADPEEITFVKEGEDLRRVRLPKSKPIRVLNQTTLSTRGVRQKVQSLRALNPDIAIADPMGICYATDNRQDSLYGLFDDPQKPIDFLIVVGSQNSHNSQELRNIGVSFLGEDNAKLIDTWDDINPAWFINGTKRVGLTAGASVLDEYTESVLEWFRQRGSSLTFLIGKEDDPRFYDLTFQKPLGDIQAAKSFIERQYAS